MKHGTADVFCREKREDMEELEARQPENTDREFRMRTEYQHRGGEQKLHMRFARSAVSDYENHVILENMCPAFLDMYASRNGADLDIYYRMTGYVGMKSYIKSRLFSGHEILKIAAELMEAVKSCENYLIFPEYISLRTDHIFVSRETGSLRLMYLPGYRTTKAMKKLIVSLIEELSGANFREESDRKLILEYRDKLLANEYGIQGCINLAEELIRRGNRKGTEDPFPERKKNMELTVADRASETESEYFDTRVNSLISVKKKLAEFMENLLS